jgi:hypothetical protein
VPEFGDVLVSMARCLFFRASDILSVFTFPRKSKKNRELDGLRNRINEKSGENLLLRPF